MHPDVDRTLAWTASAGRLLVGAAMIWAGWAKIPEPELFAQTVRGYDVLPVALIHPFAVVVPWMELVAGLMLVVGVWTQAAAIVSLGLLVSFGIAIGVNLYRGADLSCGCFAADGTGGTLTEAALRDGVMILLTAAIVWAKRYPMSVDDWLLKRGGGAVEGVRPRESGTLT